MKEYMMTSGKWFAIGGLVALVGLMMAVGLGRKRGTKAYRWRVAMWALALTLLGGSTVLTTSGCDGLVMCYDPVQTDLGSDKEDVTSELPPVACYAADIGPMDSEPTDMMCYLPDLGQPDQPQPTCYAEMPPDVTPDPQSEDVQKIQPDVIDEANETPDAIQMSDMMTCYLVADIGLPEKDVSGEDKDLHDQDGKVKEDIPPMCYFAGE
jgi:hypothetical protein